MRVDHSKAYQAVERIKTTVQPPAATVNSIADKLLATPAPEISILLCSYNREQKVGRRLEALANQSIDSSRYEVICVNDGSTDATGAQMKAGLKSLRGRYIEHESNKALAAARNTAIAAATGKIYFLSMTILTLLRHFLKNTLRPINNTVVKISRLPDTCRLSSLQKSSILLGADGCQFVFRLQRAANESSAAILVFHHWKSQRRQTSFH